jgi:hypothetical protein
MAALSACSPRQPAADASASPAPCSPVSGPLPEDARAETLRGSYRLLLVATGGKRAGDSTTAILELTAADDSLTTRPGPSGLRDTTTRYPLVGWTTADPTAVGGVDTGPLDARDPAAPGVLVIERTRASGPSPSIMLRLGAEANRRDRLRFDGGYFTLTVLQIDPRGFAGTWAGAAGGPAAGGHFCASRAQA